jgi:predicted metal-dependent hydrolase
VDIEANEIAYSESVPLDWNCRSLSEGLACYRKGEFFQAHEHWEAVWLTLAEPEKSFLQALIQVTAAFHHLAAGNSAGTASLLRRALRRLERCPSHFGGIDVKPLSAEISEWLRRIETGARSFPVAHPQIRPTGPPPIDNS